MSVSRYGSRGFHVASRTISVGDVLNGQEVGKIDQRDHGVFGRDQSGKEVQPLALRDARHRFDLRRVERHDVQNSVCQQTDRLFANLDDDHDVERRCLRQPLAEAAAEVDNWDDDAAQVEHAANIVGLPGQGRDIGPTLDLTYRHDIDAKLIFADGKADELRRTLCGARGIAGCPFDWAGLVGDWIWVSDSLLAHNVFLTYY